MIASPNDWAHVKEHPAQLYVPANKEGKEKNTS